MLCTRIIPRFPLTRVPLADLNGVLGNYATLGLNIADFARYADKPSATNVQAIVIPVIFSEFPPHILKSILLIIWINSYCWPAWHLHCRSRSDGIWPGHLEPHRNHRSVDGIRVPRWPRCCRLWRHRLDHRHPRYQYLGQLHKRGQRPHVILPQVHQHPSWSTACCRHW
jgi:hypothetical protein